MSFDYCKNFRIKDGKVLVDAAASNVYPRSYSTTEYKAGTKALNEQGKYGLYHMIAVSVLEGNFRLVGRSKLTKQLEEAISIVRPEQYRWLDCQTQAAFIAAYMAKQDFDVQKELEILKGYTKSPEKILEMAERDPQVFHYADESVTKNRDTAKKYIKKCGDMVLFHMPEHFVNDRELVEDALRQNGCVFRDLYEKNSELISDRKIILLAYREDMKRRCHEFLPSLLPMAIRNDARFMQCLIKICPSLHCSCAREMFSNIDIVRAWARFSNWTFSDLQYQGKLTRESASDFLTVSYLLERCAGKGAEQQRIREKVLKQIRELDVEFPSEKEQSLYMRLLLAGVPVIAHESDIYIDVSPETKKIIETHEKITGQKVVREIFHSAIDGQLMYDLAFAYLPAFSKEHRDLSNLSEWMVNR